MFNLLLFKQMGNGKMGPPALHFNKILFSNHRDVDGCTYFHIQNIDVRDIDVIIHNPLSCTKITTPRVPFAPHDIKQSFKFIILFIKILLHY